MEVLMTRTHRRISRALVALVAVTFALGLVFWLHNLATGKAASTADASNPRASTDAGVPLTKPNAAETQLAVDIKAPTTKPSPDLLVAITELATTQPDQGAGAANAN